MLHLTGKEIVFGIEKSFDGIRYLDIIPKNSGYGYVQYLDMSYLAISHDMGHDITTDRDISFDITPDHLETPGKCKFNENPPPRCGLLLFFSALSLPSSWLILRLAFFVVLLLSISWIALTVLPANNNLAPSGLSLLPERMFVFVSLFFFFSFFISFPVSFPS